MNNLIKKVLLAGAVALAALGSSSVRPAQAQTPTPTNCWKVTLSSTGGADIVTFPVGTPTSWIQATPPSGLNGMGNSKAKIGTQVPTSTSNTDYYKQDLDITARFQWIGPNPAPSSVQIQEDYYARAKIYAGIDGSPFGGYGSAIDFTAVLAGVSATTTTIPGDDTGKKCTAALTTTIQNPGSDFSITRHILCNINVDWNLEPSITERPDKYQTDWQYLVSAQ